MPFSVREGSVVGGGELSPSLKYPPPLSGGGLDDSSTTRVRARRMASSPSLGQHHPSSSSSSYSQQATSPPSSSHQKRGNSYGMASPPSLPSRPQFMPPMPPVPPLPSSLKVLRSASGKQYVLKSGSGGARRLKVVGGGDSGADAAAAAAGPGSILSNSAASSEDMELSANEDEDGETMMMAMDDGEERENGAGHLHRVRGSRPSRAAMSPSSPPLDDFSSRNSMRHYEDNEEDLVMATNSRDETRQGDLEDEDEEEEDEKRGDREDSRVNGRTVPADPFLDDNYDNNNNNNSGSISTGRPNQDRLPGDDYLQLRSSPTLNKYNDNNNNAWPSRVRVEFDEDMEADSDVETQEQAERTGMHGSTPQHPYQTHQQRQQFSRRHDNNETSYDHGHEKEQDEEGDREVASWEQGQTERERMSLHSQSMYHQQQKQQQGQHSRQHSSNDRDEDKVEEVRMEFKSLHSSS